jgi:D-beta-D-heptose 7-phosphate kinase/D-beta-D-heptose 1-phosphate adenosyltransferase
MKVVFTNGCFDILHVGHVRFLGFAKAQGDYLIVGLNSDESFRRHKDREPINSEQDRYEVLAALRCVDEVRIFDEDTPLHMIAEISPDFLVKGCDYEPEDVVGREYAGKVLCLGVGTTVRTTSIIEKIRQEIG